jgi:hypothetical protein
MFRITAPRAGVFAAVALLATTVFLTTYAHIGGSSQSVSDKVEVELVTLRPAGFEPAEMTRPKGPFVLTVDDRSGLEKSSLKLVQENGNDVRQLKTDRRKTEWHDVLDLPPGAYVLVETNHPEWTFRLVVQP